VKVGLERKPREIRVALRHPVIADGDEVIALNRLSRKLHHPWVYPPIDDSSWSSYIQRLEGSQHDGFLVCLRDTGAIVGGFSRGYLKIGGRWRDHERWAITLEDWRLNRARP